MSIWPFARRAESETRHLRKFDGLARSHAEAVRQRPVFEGAAVHGHPEWWLASSCDTYFGTHYHYGPHAERCYWKYDARHWDDRQIERLEREVGNL